MDEDGEDRQRIAGLLHELRQPLNMIVLSCNNIQNRARLEGSGIDQEYLVRKMSGIMDSIRNSADIIDRIEEICKSRR